MSLALLAGVLQALLVEVLRAVEGMVLAEIQQFGGQAVSVVEDVPEGKLPEEVGLAVG